MKKLLILFSLLLLALVSVKAQDRASSDDSFTEPRNDITPIIGVHLTARKTLLGLVYRKEVVNRVYVSPEVLFHLPSSGQGVLYNVNGNVYYDIMRTEGYKIFSMYLLGGVGFANYTAYPEVETYEAYDEELDEYYEKTRTNYEFEKGRTIFINTGIGMDTQVAKNQFIRLEFRVAIGDNNAHGMLNAGWGFRF